METFGRIADGTELLQWKFEGDRIVRSWRSLNETAILEDNARIRSNGMRRNELFSGGLRMSRAIEEHLKRKYPVLRHGSAVEKALMWEKIMRDIEYRKLWLHDRRI